MRPTGAISLGIAFYVFETSVDEESPRLNAARLVRDVLSDSSAVAQTKNRSRGNRLLSAV